MSYAYKNMIMKFPIRGAKKNILVALAELADNNGGSIFPSFGLLAIHIGSTREWVTKLMKEICQEGFIKKLTNHRHRPNSYCFDVPFIHEFNAKQQNEVCREVLTDFTPNEENRCELTSQRCELTSLKLSYNYQLTNNTYVQKISFNEKTEPIQKPELPVMQEKIPDRVEEQPVGPPIPKPLPSPIEKAEKKPSKVKPEKVIKSRIDPDMELTSERAQFALDQGLHATWINTEFEKFKEYFVAKGEARPGWDLSWKNWCRGAIEKDTYNRKTQPHPIHKAPSFSGTAPSGTAQSNSVPLAQQPKDENLREFLDAHPDLVGRWAFSEASMRKVGDEITISHDSEFSLSTMRANEWELKDFFKVSKLEFTTETVKKPVQIWPPKPQPQPASPPPVEQKPSRYRTLNENYQAAGNKTIGASLASIQREYHNKLKTQVSA